MYLLTLILLALLIFLLIIFIITLATKCSVVEARNKVIAFIKEVFFAETPQQEVPQWTYGISIGIDDLGNAHADIIEHEFEGLKKIFDDFYFSSYECEKNRIAYVFIVDEAQLEFTDADMYALCLKRSTAIVHRILHQYNPYAGYIPDLVSCKIMGNTVIIYIAENDTGRMENAIFARRVQNVLRQPKMPQTTPLEESWNTNV